MLVEVHQSIIDYARFSYSAYVPLKRTGGFNETRSQKRGDGDLSDLIGKFVVYDLFTKNKKIAKIELMSGVGDTYDLMTRFEGEWKTWNIKTSSYAPFRDGLHLYVKEEEINKPFTGYIQVFVHLDESKDSPPHVHIAGHVLCSSKTWKDYSSNIITIPNTRGASGIKIPIGELKSFSLIVDSADRKF